MGKGRGGVEGNWGGVVFEAVDASFSFPKPQHASLFAELNISFPKPQHASLFAGWAWAARQHASESWVPKTGSSTQLNCLLSQSPSARVTPRITCLHTLMKRSRAVLAAPIERSRAGCRGPRS